MMMPTTAKPEAERSQIADLLPWYAAGSLSSSERHRVETAISRDDELARHYRLIREELVETIHLNESLGAPSAGALERLDRAIAAEAQSASRRPSPRRLTAGIGSWLSGFSPRALAWSASAAMLVLVLQGGLLTGLYVNETSKPVIEANQPSGMSTASYPQTQTTEGAHVLIAFAPQANAAEITKFLETHKASIVDGPRAGGIYKLRINPSALPSDGIALVAKQMRQAGKVVQFVAPTE